MNQYPAWKNFLVIVLVAVGVLYALPNLYGEDPSVQITAGRDAQLDEALINRIKTTLGDQQLEPKSLEENEEHLLLRYTGTETQLRAADLLRTELGTNYTVALNLAPNTPGWLRSINARPMVLGLDLRGGVHFLMQVDMEAAKKQQLEKLRDDVRSVLREDKVRYVRVKELKDRIEILLRNSEDREKASDAISDSIQELELSDFNSEGRAGLHARIRPQQLVELQKTALQQNITTLRNRVNELGVAEPLVQQQGSDRIVVQLPGVQDTAVAKEILGATATLEYRAVDEKNDAFSAQESGHIPVTSRLYTHKNGYPVLLKKRLIVSGDQLVDARAGFDTQSGSPEVSVTLNSVGAKRMLDFTRDNVGNGMAVVFVERKPIYSMIDGKRTKTGTRVEERVISVATIRDVFSKRFRTTGLDSPKEATQLALLLRAGALAAPVEIIEERTVGPSLGQENIDKGFMSVMIGFMVVLVFMGVYYRLFGLVANVALFLNLVLIVALLSLIGATLTLPGIAGIVLTVGMAVDANVLIFERIREELRTGNTPQASIRAGYEKAFSTIADANVTTLIAAIVLLSFGTGPIKGFAVTLSLGIASSMFTAIMGTRAVINKIYGSRKRVKSLAI